MKKYKKILIDAILFFVIIGLTLYGVFHGEDLSGLKDAIKEMMQIISKRLNY